MSALDYIFQPKVLPYEDTARKKVLDALFNSYPSFKSQLAFAPKQALIDLANRFATNPAGYVSESLLGGIGGIGEAGPVMRGIDSGVDVLDELSGAIANYVKAKSRSSEQNPMSDFLKKMEESKS